ncbi:MAG: HlyD family efflux transporter periplasmic adaptor subunit [Ferruginibacter sp.]
MLLSSCNQKNNTESTIEETSEPVTPVTVITINSGPIEEYVELNATSVYQQKWIIRSNITGYLQTSGMQLNKFVNKGQAMFAIKTKEAQSIGNTISILDSSFRFSGVNAIRSNGTGFISEINHQPGDYIQEGEQLAVVTDTKSFIFLLDMPYEMRPYIIGKDSVLLMLPGGENIPAFVAGSMPSMDSASQTQRVILKINANHVIPENLIAKVRLVKNANTHAYYLPKEAVITDEAQSNFWIMKMINDSMAVKVVIKKGMEAAGNIEIVSPVFSGTDKILLTGNYGLPDTARVKIVSDK